jgi:signal transduction histidine kinase
LGLPIPGAIDRALTERRSRGPLNARVALPWRTSTIGMAIVIGAASVVMAALHRHNQWGFHHQSFRVAIDTAAGIGAFAAAWLMRVRYKRTESMQSWLLFTGLGCYAFTALFTFFLPGALAGSGIDMAGVPVFGRVLAGVLLVSAAFADSGPMRRPPSIATSIEFIVGISAACAVAGIALAARLPHVFSGDVTLPIRGIENGSALFIAAGAATVALYVFCGAALWTRAAAVNDSTVGWLAIGAALAGISRLDALLLTSGSASWVSAGDGVRLAATAAFVAASAAEFARFEQRLTDAITADERRRLARELHDGVAQDLAFVVSHTSALARRNGDQQVMRDIACAAERAMSDSRRAIHLLNRPRSRALSPVLAERSYELCSRYGLELDFAMLGGEVHATPEVEHAVLQIVSEALANATKHAGAQTVSVELESTGGGFTVRVHDDGCGFDTTARPTRRRLGGFGLISMEERARALGGELEVTSDPDGGGTTVEARFK